MSVLHVLLIEDEPPALAYLERTLQSVVDKRANDLLMVVGRIMSCAEARVWFQTHSPPDLILCDIQLSDGSALELFHEIDAPAPIIFCTAYDQFVLASLDVGGMDYLLKPIVEDRLNRALEKLSRIGHAAGRRASNDALRKTTRALEDKHLPPSRFVVKSGSDFVSVSLDDVAYFYSAHKLTTLVQKSGANAYVDESLAALVERVGVEDRFYRVNRAFLIAHDCIESFRPAQNGRMALKLRPPSPKVVHVSQENAAAFKRWFAGER